MEPVDDDDDLIDWAEEYGVLIGAAFWSSLRHRRLDA